MMNPHSNGKAHKEPESMPEGIDEVGTFLKRWPDPAPDAEAKAQLMAALIAAMDTQEQAHSRASLQKDRRRSLRWAALLLRSQIRLVHPATWAASSVVIALGALVTLLLYQPAQTGAELPLVIVAPLVAACGVAFLYGLEADPALELQLATPVSPRLILLARLALLFSFNLAITLVCSVFLALTRVNLSLFPLIAAWLAPMTFLSALAFLLSVIFFDSLVSMLISFLLWGAITARHFVEITPFFLPDVLHMAYYPAMLIAAPMLVIVALWRVAYEERWTGETH